MAEQSFQEWYQAVIQACNHHEADVAAFALGQWDKMIGGVPEPRKTELMRIKDKLLYTAFPSLSLNQTAEIVEKRLLNVIVSEVDIEEIMDKRFLFLGYGNDEPDRETLRQAALKNQQRLGNKTVSEWLHNFDRILSVPELAETENAVGEFFRREATVTSLKKNEQAVLRILLQTYEDWLRQPLTSIFDSAVVYKKLKELKQSGVKEVNVNTFARDYLGAGRNAPSPLSRSPGRASVSSASRDQVSLSLLQALSKYHQLAQQQITGEKIKLRSQVEPVRPTLMNWLKYYRSELGIGYHDSVKRGDFLYRSENGRKLSPTERDRIALILKSIEEDFPVSIDTGRSEIIFPENTPTVRPQERKLPERPPTFTVKGSGPVVPAPVFSAPSIPVYRPPAAPERVPQTNTPAFSQQPASGFPVNAPPSPKVAPEPFHITRAPRGTSAQPLENSHDGSNISFSSSHVFPAEKENLEDRIQFARPSTAAEERLRTAPQTDRPLMKNFPSNPQVSPQPQATSLPKAVEPPLAPARPTTLPRPAIQKVTPPNRFQITPISLQEENEELGRRNQEA